MTVKELIEILKNEDSSRIVIMSRDSEGNSFSPLSEVGTAAYRPTSSWCGETGLEELTEENQEQGFAEEDVITDGVKAIVLWPTN